MLGDTMMRAGIAETRLAKERGPLAGQVGGDHYSKLAIQPMQFSMANGWDPSSHSALKYITRYRDKDGEKDLRKARHAVELYMELAPKRSTGDRIAKRITMAKYCKANALPPAVAVALYLLEELVNGGPTAHGADRVLAAIDRLIIGAAKACAA